MLCNSTRYREPVAPPLKVLDGTITEDIFALYANLAVNAGVFVMVIVRDETSMLPLFEAYQ